MEDIGIDITGARSGGLISSSNSTTSTGDLNERSNASFEQSLSNDFMAVTIDADLENGNAGSDHSLDSSRRSFGSARRRRRQATPRSQSDLGPRGQSKRISEILVSKTEIYGVDPTQPEPIPEELAQLLGEQKKHAGGSGMKYWKSELQTAIEHGGDYNTRLDTAIRTSLGSFLVFALLVFTHQKILGAVWIGNIFMHSSLKDSFGASLLSLHEFGTSILLTTAMAWPAGFLLSHLTEAQACLILPFLVFVYTFFIMSCPQLCKYICISG